MWSHSQLTTGQIKNLILTGKILFGGNTRLKIYGTLSCASGKRMKKQHRVFFSNEGEAKRLGLELADIACEKSIYSGLRKNQVEIPADLPQF
jgi:hypothetical protein